MPYILTHLSIYLSIYHPLLLMDIYCKGRDFYLFRASLQNQRESKNVSTPMAETAGKQTFILTQAQYLRFQHINDQFSQSIKIQSFITYRCNSARQILAQPVLELIFFVIYLGPLPFLKRYRVLSSDITNACTLQYSRELKFNIQESYLSTPGLFCSRILSDSYVQ